MNHKHPKGRFHNVQTFCETEEDCLGNTLSGYGIQVQYLPFVRAN